MPISLRSSLLGAIYYRFLDKAVIPRLQKWGVKPNQITLAGMIMAAAVPLGFWIHPAPGLAFILLSGLADSLDGQLARSNECTSTFGAFLDSSLDRLSDWFYLTGFWIMLWCQSARLGATLLFLFAQLFTLLISYVKARAGTLNVCCRAGLMDRGMRVVYFLLWAAALIIFPHISQWVLWIGLVVYTGLTLLTVVQRILHVRARLAIASPYHNDLNS